MADDAQLQWDEELRRRIGASQLTPEAPSVQPPMPYAQPVTPDMVTPQGGIYTNRAEQLKDQRYQQSLSDAGIEMDKGAAIDTRTGNYVTNPNQAASQNRLLQQNELDAQSAPSQFQELSNMAMNSRARQEALQAQRNALYNQLNSAPQGYRGRQSQQARNLEVQLRGVTNDMQQEQARERMYLGASAHQSLQDLKAKQDAAHMQSFSQLTNDFQNIDAAPQTPEWYQSVLTAIGNNPQGANTVIGRKVIGHQFGIEPPTADQVNELVRIAHDKGLTQTKVTVGPKKATMQAEPETVTREKELKKSYGVTLDMIKNPMDAKVGRVATKEDVDAGKKNSEGKLVAAGDIVADSKGDQINFATGTVDAKGVPKRVTMPLQTYLDSGGKLSQETVNQRNQPAAPQAGVVQGGYKFKGGDPGKKENWEKVQ